MSEVDGHCWYGSRDWTSMPIFYYILLPCNRWQQRGSLTKWRLTWEWRWSRDISLNSSMWKKLHPLTFIIARWMSMDTNQWMWAQWGNGCAFQQWWQQSVRQAMFQTAMHSCHIMKWRASQSVHPCESVDHNCVWSWISALMHWKWWWQRWNITKFLTSGSHRYSYRIKKNTICEFVRTIWKWRLQFLRSYH